MYYLNTITWKISLIICRYMCIHHSEMITLAKQKGEGGQKASNSYVWMGVFYSCFSYFITVKNTKYLGKYFVSPPLTKNPFHRNLTIIERNKKRLTKGERRQVACSQNKQKPLSAKCPEQAQGAGRTETTPV